MGGLAINKFKTVGELKKIIESERNNGKTIIFANGCFDILHAGHIRYLKGAKELGDILIVAVNSDQSVKAIKGNDRPFLHEDDRIEILSAIECIDYIVLFEERDVSKLLLTFKPDVQVKGTDYTEESVPEASIVKSYGGRVAIAGDPKTRSSTELLTKLKK